MTTQHKRFACRDGDRGLATSRRTSTTEYTLVERHGDRWYAVLDGKIHMSEVSSFASSATVYRDLTLTDVWVEPLPPVEVEVGMRVSYVGYSYHGGPLPDAGDTACGRVSKILPPERDGEGGGFAIIRTDSWPDNLAIGREDRQRYMYNYRCARTGAPLCLPKGDANAH